MYEHVVILTQIDLRYTMQFMLRAVLLLSLAIGV